MYDYGSLPNKKDDNSPGLKKRVLVAPRSTFTALEAPSNAGLAAGDTVVIPGNHTFGLNDGFIELYTVMDTGELTGETIGDRGSRSVNPKVTAFHPGLYAEALEFGNKAKDDDFIVLVETLKDTFIQLGRDGLEAEITYSFSAGKVSGGANGLTFNIESFGGVFIYEGSITLKP